MSRILEKIRDLFTEPVVDPFVPEEDPFIQRVGEAHANIDKRRKSRHEQWRYRNAMERELLGNREGQDDRV